MKINTKRFSEFLKRCMMSGTQQIDDMLLKFQRDGLRVAQDSKPNQVRVYGFLKKEAFDSYEEIGTIGMTEINRVIKVVERFGKDIEMSKNSNVLQITSGNKTVQIELAEEEYIADVGTELKLDKFKDFFEMNAEELDDIIKDAQVEKDTIIKIETQVGKATFTNKGKYKFTRTLEISTIIGGAKVLVGQPFIEALNNIEGNLKVSIGNDYPVMIEMTSEFEQFKYIIAPRDDKE